MPTKLFGASWMRQTKQSLIALEDANVSFEFVDINDQPYMAGVLTTVLGEYQLPVLFVDGRPYKGGSRINEYLREATK